MWSEYFTLLRIVEVSVVLRAADEAPMRASGVAVEVENALGEGRDVLCLLHGCLSDGWGAAGAACWGAWRRQGR